MHTMQRWLKSQFGGSRLDDEQFYEINKAVLFPTTGRKKRRLCGVQFPPGRDMGLAGRGLVVDNGFPFFPNEFFPTDPRQECQYQRFFTAYGGEGDADDPAGAGGTWAEV